MKHLVLVILLSVSYLITNGQLRDFQVKALDTNISHDLQNDFFPDNGVIIVYSDIVGLTFRSSAGGINKQNHNRELGRYEILINPIRQIIFIQHQKYIESRLGVINPKPKECFVYRVEDENQMTIEGKGDLKIKTLPTEAAIFINNAPILKASPTDLKLQNGKYSVRIEKKMYRPFDTIVQIIADKTTNIFIDLIPDIEFKITPNQWRIIEIEDEIEEAIKNEDFTLAGTLERELKMRMELEIYISEEDYKTASQIQRKIFKREFDENPSIKDSTKNRPNKEIAPNRIPSTLTSIPKTDNSRTFLTTGLRIGYIQTIGEFNRSVSNYTQTIERYKGDQSGFGGGNGVMAHLDFFVRPKKGKFGFWNYLGGSAVSFSWENSNPNIFEPDDRFEPIMDFHYGLGPALYLGNKNYSLDIGLSAGIGINMGGGLSVDLPDYEFFKIERYLGVSYHTNASITYKLKSLYFGLLYSRFFPQNEAEFISKRPNDLGQSRHIIQTKLPLQYISINLGVFF